MRRAVCLAMKVGFQNREVRATDIGEIGYCDLRDRFKWTKIGQTTAWNWQAGVPAAVAREFG